ncbi:molybdate ABC transporter substrate-binding protein [Vibrio diazotrophicus]|uniref:Molybdate ABC transporter substrate-binding protein n=1 Tax=Vibrio diazotrophicus TaxID=685 RepID=A0A2J8I7U7_VIBDI|nr:MULTISPECIES: molybdate ABC transporter substrate-binding protein [Vibrio]MCF7362308.1 molybdate ABC transporter substrate-binding protein [Vibrio sp. A1-b2]PNI06571.1 molybdate ABC transporter substrate-binding protein [Vibrio diazotrophicus]
MKGFHRFLLRFILHAFGLVGLILGSFSVQAEDGTLAVANNFYAPIQMLVDDFAKVSGFQLSVSTGSTGQLYAQIVNGAPFDLFLAADTVRPEKLVNQGLGFEPFVYARGVLVLWSKQANYDVKEHMLLGDYNHFAIADPKLAPYGLAAQQALTKMGLWESMTPKIVMGKGLNPTFQFLSTGNAQLGMVAKSQVFKNGQHIGGSFWEVPVSDYEPIEQAAVTLKIGVDKAAINAFLEYYSSERAQKIVSSFGYLQ